MLQMVPDPALQARRETLGTEIHRVAALCRMENWRRLLPHLFAMHLPADVGPEVLVQWLLETVGPSRAEAQRLLRAMERQPWRALRLTGPRVLPVQLGFCVAAGRVHRWLQLEGPPRWRIVRIEAARGPSL